MYSGGSGTQFDPYLIATPQDLHDVRENPGAYFKQIADIDLSNFGEFEAPSVNFTGVFDGGNFSIKNGTIIGGLFGVVSGGSALVQNVKLEDVNVVSVGSDTGGIVRRLENGAIKFCRVIGGKITSNHSNTGGIVGYMLRAQVEFCWSDLSIESTLDYVGGIAGYCHGIKIANCYALGDAAGRNNIGGIAGHFTGETGTTFILEKCYAAGHIAGQSAVGGIAGYVTGYSPGRQYYAEVRNCFALNKAIIRNVGSNHESFGRVVGMQGSLTRLINNHALESMKFYPQGLQE